MEFIIELRRAYYFIGLIGNVGLQLLWHILHLIINIFYLMVGIACVVESYLISSGQAKYGTWPFQEIGNVKLADQNHMTLEFASFPDGKEAVTKAANFLFEKYITLNTLDGDQGEKIFTEAHMTEALKAIEPDLLLVFGPVRCHLGFLVHMGPLKSMRYGSLVKAIYKFATVRQNYGK
ncbi:hypothetical protein UlMin_032381 [Ulmus minor]